MRETWVWSLSQEDPLEKEMATTPVLLPGKSHGWRGLVGYSPWGRKESDTTEQFHYYYVHIFMFFLLFLLEIHCAEFVMLGSNNCVFF